MKRTGYLYEQITTMENLKIAYYKAMKGKRTKKSVLLFKINQEKNLERLLEELKSKKYSLGNYHYFKIYDPKERAFCAASFEERILHHAVMNVLEPYFEEYQIRDSYACRKEKGTLKALQRALYLTRNNSYFLKLDIRKYFDSIDHTVLKNLLRRKFKDAKLLKFLDTIIDSYVTSSGKGIPIGNLTSQYFANHYLGMCDHFIKEDLRVKGYVRYMDDMVLWSSSSEYLKRMLPEIKHFLCDRLALDLKEPYMNKTTEGLPFLGFLVKMKGIYLTGKQKRRSREKLNLYNRLYEKGEWSEREAADHVIPLVSHLEIARSRYFR